MKHIKTLSDISHHYDTYLVDVVGVVWDGQDPIMGAITAINTLIEQDKRVIFLSNNPRPSDGLYKKLVEYGITPKVQALCSGDATVQYIERNFPGKTVYHLGANRNDEILSQTNYKTTERIVDSDFILLTAYLNPDEDLTMYAQDLDWIIQHKPRILCANPDVYAPMEEGQLRRCGGYIGHHLEQHGVSVDYMGKPSAMIYEMVFQMFNIDPSHKSKCLMIGDTLETDITGAAGFGIDSLLVLTGNTGREILSVSSSIENPLKTKNIIPTYITEEL